MKNLNKKNRFYPKVKTKSLTILLVTFLLSALVCTQLIGEVSAAIDYTEYTGTLDGADWALRIPDPWNGMLVVYCRGASKELPDPSGTLRFCNIMLEQGFAVAASNYGAVGRCYSAAVKSTYELTMHIIDNYDVTGKIFLHGVSLGGTPALLLGEKYPDVYSGVLEMMGAKDMKFSYTLKSRWANLSDAELEAEMTALGITTIPPPIYSTLDEWRSRCANQTRGLVRETGGTPETHPQEYEDRSPTYHANIQIPVITVHGTDDAIVPYYNSILYQDAVAKAGRSHLYRLYTVADGGHNGGVLDEKPARFNELVEWSNELTGAHDWPMRGCNAQRCGYSTSSAPNTNQTLWINTFNNLSFAQGGGSAASPAVVDGKVYIPAYDDNLYCFDAASGALLWNYTAGDNMRSSCEVFDGNVYATSRDQNVYCFDALTGTKIWSYKTDGVPGMGAVVAGGKAYVGSESGKLYCLRADWGQVEWTFTAGAAIDSSPTFAHGKIFFGSMDNKIYCVDAATGTLVWSYTTGDNVYSVPAVAGGKVYVGSFDDNVYCLDALTGARIWSYATSDNIWYAPAIAYGKVYVCSTDSNIYCFDAASGTLVWNYTVGRGIVGQPAVADGKVYFGSLDTNFYCLDAETGAFIWSFETGGMVWGSPVVANGVVYAVSMDSTVYAFSAWEPIPEGLTIGVMLLLSTVAVVVSVRYFRKRQKWENW